jgi:hypothetical protein
MSQQRAKRPMAQRMASSKQGVLSVHNALLVVSAEDEQRAQTPRIEADANAASPAVVIHVPEQVRVEESSARVMVSGRIVHVALARTGQPEESHAEGDQSEAKGSDLKRGRTALQRAHIEAQGNVRDALTGGIRLVVTVRLVQEGIPVILELREVRKAALLIPHAKGPKGRGARQCRGGIAGLSARDLQGSVRNQGRWEGRVQVDHAGITLVGNRASSGKNVGFVVSAISTQTRRTSIKRGDRTL